MTKAGRKAIDFEHDQALQKQLRDYVNSLPHLKENDKRCQLYFQENPRIQLTPELQKWMIVLRREMLLEQKRQAILQRIRVQQNLNETEKLALDLSTQSDRESFFVLQKALDSLVKKENDKQIQKTQTQQLKRLAETLNQAKPTSRKSKDQQKFFIGGVLQQLRHHLEPELNDLEFLKLLLEGLQFHEDVFNRFDGITKDRRDKRAKEILQEAEQDLRNPILKPT